MLYWEITRIPIRNIESKDLQSSEEACVASGIELCQLAALVYLERAAGSFHEGKSTATHKIERAFSIFSGLQICERTFPLLIFACEARHDAQRAIILDLIDRTQKNYPSRSLDFAASMIQSVWIQDDLSDQEIGYVDRLSVILSSSKS